ncbi:MAG: uroporphyrinogen decarboxylase [Planctomycetes bacterium]|nr:uroporphyrinogen decarboxylase [Planctomycetota bacterium]
MPSPPAPDSAAKIGTGCHGQAESAEPARADHCGEPSSPSPQVTNTPRNDLLLRAARGERTERTPVWLMRQAGRFDPQYQRIRQECGLELEDLFRTPELAAQITMLPVRLGVDAAILFQDILTPLAPMGAHFVFRPGPVLSEPIRSSDQVANLRLYDPAIELSFIPRSIDLTLQELDGEIPLLGFAGAPLTLATFLIEGGSPGRSVDNVKTLMHKDPATCHQLLEKLAAMTADYLRMQIEAGVHAIQLFESVGDLFSARQYETFAMPYQQRIMKELEGLCPRILFVKENSRIDLMAQTGADVLSVGKCVDLRKARTQLGDHIALQGNVDNQVLLSGTKDEITRAVQDCIEAGNHKGHILNLNHGILKDTPFDNVRHFIEAAKSHRLEPAALTGES